MDSKSEGRIPNNITEYLVQSGSGCKCETTGHPGKQPDGSAKTREVKIVALWSADRRDSDNLPTSDPGSVSYCAAIESASTLETDKMVSAFARRVEREATRRDFQNAKRQVVIVAESHLDCQMAVAHAE